MLSVVRDSALVALLATASAAMASGPCDSGFKTGNGFRGVHGVVYGSTMWDPDGAGPRTPILVMVGSFDLAGTVSANNVATYDPATGSWGTLGNGLGDSNSLLYSATVLSTGELVAAGGFAGHVAKWNRISGAWEVIGSAISSGFVTALTPLPGGGLVAGGNFYSLNGGSAGHIAKWDGAVWTNMNGGVFSGGSVQVFSLTTLTNGDVIAGGLFSSAGGVPAQNIARWSPSGGGTWSAFGSGANGYVTSLASLPANGFLAGGNFNNIAGNTISGIARYTAPGGTWSAIGTGIPGGVATIYPQPNGDILAGGYFDTAGGNSAPYIAKWTASASSWSALGGGTNNVVRSIQVFSSGNIAACGDMTQANGLPNAGLQIWTGTAWLNWPGFNSLVTAVAGLPAGDAIAAGYFTTAGTGAVGYIARRSGTTWSPIGAGLDGVPQALVALPDNGFIVGGAFSTAGSTSVSNIARCSSAGDWSTLGAGVDDEVKALCRASNGDILVGGYFQNPGANIARWNGTSWSALGSGPGGTVLAIAELPDGRIVAGGEFSIEEGAVADRIAIWDGAEWSPLADGFDGPVHALAILPSGDIVAGGAFENSGASSLSRIARWDGAAWQDMSGGVTGWVNALVVSESGELYVGGDFAFGGSVYSVGYIRWNITGWTALSLGVRGGVRALAEGAPGSMHLGGNFLTVGNGYDAGGICSPYFADWSAPTLRITSQPEAASNCPTGQAVFHVGASGVGALSYQWYKYSDPIDTGLNPSAATATLVIDHPTIDDSAWYHCVVSDDCGSVESQAAPLLLTSCCPADLNNDGLVDDADFQIFVVAYNELICPEFPIPCAGDLNYDGYVDDADFQIFVPAYNALLCP